MCKMAICFLLISFLVFIFNNGVSSYMPSQDLESNFLVQTLSHNTRRHRNSPVQTAFNVDDFAAKADGTDDHQAFKKAWEATCNSTSDFTVLTVSHRRTYLLKPLIFSGPCEAKSITVMIKGKLKASSNRSDWSGKEEKSYWIKFRNISHLTVKGGGELNGSGQIWWPHSCKINSSLPCVHAPTALVFYQCKHLRVRDLTLKDSQQVHVVFSHCTDVEASDLTIRAPQWSPNTDGIHITGTRRMTISNCFIGTGDDCISIVSGSKNVFVTNIVCGPGHGISIGSLGANNSRAHVSHVVVEKATLIGTTNGVRIKTWQGGHGYAKNIIFRDISMCNVSNPIIINQNYCDSTKPCYQQNSAVAVKGVLYQNIRGTSFSDIAVNFNCSKAISCRNIELKDISLVISDTFASGSSCINVRSTESGSVFPSCTRRGN